MTNHLMEHEQRFPESVRPNVGRLAEISKWLRKERELSFYGDIDFVPSEEYSKEDAERAIADARFALEQASLVIRLPE